MVITTYTQEFKTPIAPSRMFKALILDSHNLIPKIAPGGITSIEFIEGDGGVGSIKKTHFADGNPLKWVKHKIDVIDTEHLVSKYTLIESGVKFENIEFVSYEAKFEACDGGCLVKMTSEYHTEEGVELREEDIEGGKDKAFGLYKVVEEYLEDIKGGKDKAFGLYKVVEEYLIANPEAYA